MTGKVIALPVPEELESCSEALELARVLVADGSQVFIVSPHLWDDPGTWGLLLVDLARHVAHTYESRGISAPIALSSIRAAMNAEWEHPTDHTA